MRTDDVAFCLGGIVIGAHEALLIFDGAHGGADNERLVELGLVVSAEVCEEVGGPGTAVATVFGQSGIHDKAAGVRDAHKHSARDAILQIGVVFDAFEGVLLGACVLADEGIVSSAKGVAGNGAGKDGRTVELGDLAGGWRNGLSCLRRGKQVVGGGPGGTISARRGQSISFARTYSVCCRLLWRRRLRFSMRKMNWRL